MLSTNLKSTKEYKQTVIYTAEAYNLTEIDAYWFVASVMETDDNGRTIFWYDVMKEKYRQLLSMEPA